MNQLARSPELMRPDDTALLVVDLQEKLLPLIDENECIVFNAQRLIRGAEVLGVPCAGTEQYPKGLGPTTAAIRERLESFEEKLDFSCMECQTIFDAWKASERHKVLVCGIETHVCVQQTVLDLLANGFAVYVAVDAVGARHSIDHETALRRMEGGGAVLTTTEAALFEWCGRAGTDRFKEISRLIKEGGVRRS